jgi:hypothetical protein
LWRDPGEYRRRFLQCQTNGSPTPDVHWRFFSVPLAAWPGAVFAGCRTVPIFQDDACQRLERRPTAMRAPKKGFAIEFINRIRTMDPADLNALIVREAGEDLAQFFLSYSASLISRDPQKVLENTSSLMLMGYLIRAAEQRVPREREVMLHA